MFSIPFNYNNNKWGKTQCMCECVVGENSLEIGALCKRIVDPFSTGLNIDIHLVSVVFTKHKKLISLLYLTHTHTYIHTLT